MSGTPGPEGHGRTIRSFVRRAGRITRAQQRALEELMPRWGLPAGDGPIDLDAAFGRRAPRVLEIGIGDGETLLELARLRPDEDFLGIEVHPPGLGHCLLGAERLGLTNLRLIAGDAVPVLEQRAPDAAFDEVLLYFPDPWPKKRHHKRRLLQPAFAALVARRLKPGGAFRLATDWENYAGQMLEVLAAEPLLENAAPGGGYAPRPASRPVTRFEQRGRRLGHTVYDLDFRRRDG